MIKPPCKATLAKYGMTVDDWVRLCEACDYTCVVCGNPFGERLLAIDHEHVKGFKARKKRKAKSSGRVIKVRVMPPSERKKYVRGIIHHWCNRFIRKWLTLERAKSIVAYLEAFERRRDKS